MPEHTPHCSRHRTATSNTSSPEAVTLSRCSVTDSPGSIATTRPFGSGVAGTRAYLHFRGHGASSSPETPWTYRSLAHEFGAVAGHVGATQALGVSMGAGAICNLLESDPSRFDKVVLVLPAVIDRPREDEAFDRLVAMSRMTQDRDLDSLTEAPAAGTTGRAPRGLRCPAVVC